MSVVEELNTFFTSNGSWKFESKLIHDTYFSFSNRNGNTFAIGFNTLIQCLEDLLADNSNFSGLKSYVEKEWRDWGAAHYLDPVAKSLATVQTKPLFALLSKVIAWGNPDCFVHDDLEQNILLSKDALTKSITLLKKNLLPPEKGSERDPNESFTPSQIIYYGVPGCGKSHQVKEDLKAKGIPQNRTKRVVFHPDYCNADFVGQIMPETKNGGGIRYNFKAGPFAKILREAYENPKLEYALIIEEINRGNAAAIFGDIFQLLDRKTLQEQTENVNNNVYGIGWSDYCVNNDYINAYFRGAYEDDALDGPLPEKKLGDITFNDNVDIRLPPNLSIYATMNTSDQNVFTLDNAFQRRWKMKQIPNTLDASNPKEAAQYDLVIGNSGVKWGKFREEINNKIVDPDYTSNFSSLEDKRLGGWFIVPEKEGESSISKENFADKVIKFLWDDAFKFNRSIFGDYEKKSLEIVIEAFVGEVGFGIFEENFRKSLGVTESSAKQQRDGQS